MQSRLPSLVVVVVGVNVVAVVAVVEVVKVVEVVVILPGRSSSTAPLLCCSVGTEIWSKIQKFRKARGLINCIGVGI